MKKLEDLLHKVIIKKNFGYKLHRARINDGEFTFIKAKAISPKDVEIAQNILKIIKINTREDMFLALTCVALLSSHEKREKLKAKFSGNEFAEATAMDNLYLYKGCVNKIINEGIKKQLDFKFCEKLDSKSKPVTYIEFAGIQFSFHNGNTSQTAKVAQQRGLRQYGELDWNHNIAFQNGAKEIFEFALHLKNTSELMYINETPLEYAQSLINAEEARETDIKKDIKETIDNERQV